MNVLTLVSKLSAMLSNGELDAALEPAAGIIAELKEYDAPELGDDGDAAALERFATRHRTILGHLRNLVDAAHRLPIWPEGQGEAFDLAADGFAAWAEDLDRLIAMHPHYTPDLDERAGRRAAATVASLPRASEARACAAADPVGVPPAPSGRRGSPKTCDVCAARPHVVDFFGFALCAECAAAAQAASAGSPVVSR